MSGKGFKPTTNRSKNIVDGKKQLVLLQLTEYMRAECTATPEKAKEFIKEMLDRVPLELIIPDELLAEHRDFLVEKFKTADDDFFRYYLLRKVFEVLDQAIVIEYLPDDKFDPNDPSDFIRTLQLA